MSTLNTKKDNIIKSSVFTGLAFFSSILSINAAQQQPSSPQAPPVKFAKQALVDEFNAKNAGLPGKFYIDKKDGLEYILFSGETSPEYAVKAFLDSIGVDSEYGTYGIDPFKVYTYEEFVETRIFSYGMAKKRIDKWKIDGTHTNRTGKDIITQIKDWLGPKCFKKIHDYYEAKEKKDAFWNDTVYRFLNLAKQKIVWTIALAGIFLIGLTKFVYSAAGGLGAWFGRIFNRRPVLISPNNTNIYKPWYRRLGAWLRRKARGTSKITLIVNDELDKILQDLKKSNELALKKGHAFSNVLAFGEPGVGKTLFAKKLALESNMGWIYFNIECLEQYSKEDAIWHLKELFASAKRNGPTILIIDEFHTLFTKNNDKAASILNIIKTEFSSATNRNLQLFVITNYPDLVPSPMMSRLGEVIEFTTPSPSKVRKIFRLYLPRKKRYLSLELEKNELKGLVGRDIQFICTKFKRNKEAGLDELRRIIITFKKSKARAAKFELKNLKKELERQEMQAQRQSAQKTKSKNKYYN